MWFSVRLSLLKKSLLRKGCRIVRRTLYIAFKSLIWSLSAGVEYWS